MSERTNKDRRMAGQHLLEIAEQYYGNDSLRDSLTDLLTDLRHYCAKAKGISFEDAVRISEMHFEDEQR